MGGKVSYFFSNNAPQAQGVGTNINEIAGVSDAKVIVVPKDGPFTEPKKEEAKLVPVTEFWQDQTVVLHLLRRFGCPLCRKAGLEISSLKPILDKHNIRLVGIGLGYNSLDTFMEGKYWRENELYVDVEKKLYGALKLGKRNIFGIFDEKAGKARKEAQGAKVEGNLSGDGMSLGGTYVIEKGGKILLEFQQKGFGDHPELKDILTALGINASELENRLKVPEKTEEVTCK